MGPTQTTVRDPGGRRRHLFEVVQHEQQLLVLQVGLAGFGWSAHGSGKTEPARDPRAEV